MRRAPLTVAFALGVAGLPACDPASPPPDLPQGTAEITLGTSINGDSRWVDMRPGQDLELAPGAQGGFHLWLHYRVKGAAGMVVVKRQADRVASDGTRARVLTTQATQTYLAGEVFQTEYPVPSFMCPTPIGVSVIDQTIELMLRLEAPSGAFLGERRQQVVARCPPASDPQRTYCLQICAG